MSNCAFLKITSQSQKPTTKFGQMIIRKIIKIAATRCQILRLKYIKIDTPDIVGEAYSAPTTQWNKWGLFLRGTYFKGRGGARREAEKRYREVRGREEWGGEK